MIKEKIRTGIAAACIPLLGALIAVAMINVSSVHRPPPAPAGPGTGTVQDHSRPARMQAHSPGDPVPFLDRNLTMPAATMAMTMTARIHAVPATSKE